MVLVCYVEPSLPSELRTEFSFPEGTQHSQTPSDFSVSICGQLQGSSSSPKIHFPLIVYFLSIWLLDHINIFYNLLPTHPQKKGQRNCF